jgi:hypothetical protein
MFSKTNKRAEMMPVFSTDPERRAIELAFFTRLSKMVDFFNQDPNRFVELATEGKLQELLPDLDNENTPIERRAYDSLKPFDYETWVKQDK